MTDGRHLEFTKVIIIQSRIVIFARNCVCWLRSTVESRQCVKIDIGSKFKMAAAAILNFDFGP